MKIIQNTNIFVMSGTERTAAEEFGEFLVLMDSIEYCIENIRPPEI